VAVVGFGAVELAVAEVFRRRPSGAARRASRTGRPLPARRFLPWAAAIALLAAWELTSFFSHPRPQHPTISSMTDPLLAHHLIRSAAFAAWAWFGWILAE
jgi:hypothetical protein